MEEEQQGDKHAPARVPYAAPKIVLQVQHTVPNHMLHV